MNSGEQFEGFARRIKDAGAVAAGLTGVAAIFGVAWTVGFFVTLPSGVPDLNAMRIETLAPLIAVASVFVGFMAISVLGLSALPFTRLHLTGPRRKYLNETIALFFKILVLSSVALLITLECVHQAYEFFNGPGASCPGDFRPSSYLLLYHFLRSLPSPYWLFLVPASIIATSICIASLKYGKRLPTGKIFACEVASCFLWFVTVAVSYGLASMIQSERNDHSWIWQLFYVACFMVVSGATAFLAAQRNMSGTLVCGFFALISFVYQAPRHAFQMPFVFIGISQYTLDIEPGNAPRLKLDQLTRECAGTVRVNSGRFSVQVIVSLGDRYIVQCGNEGWAEITRDPQWLILGGKLAPVVQSNPIKSKPLRKGPSVRTSPG
jgi:hypothetical protein